MKQMLILDKHKRLKSVRIDMTPSESLVILDALRRYSEMCGVHESDRGTAKRIRAEFLQDYTRCEIEEGENDEQSREMAERP